MARVSVRRVDSWYPDALRRYRVLIDDEEVGRLKRGEAIELPLRPGPHVIQAAIDWKRSASFDISGDGEETIRFRCGPRATPLTALFVIFKHADDTWLFLEPDID